MAGIFVSYRRSDSQGEAGRLFDDLVPIFGEHAVFMDVSAIEAGRDFRKAIEDGVTKCGVLLVVLGPGWLSATDEAGARRLDDPSDFVRIETASALKRDIPVIPVLVRGARMPSAEQLPDELRDLAFRNCVELTHVRWKSDIHLLVEALRRLLGETSPAKKAKPSKTRAAVQEVKLDSAPESEGAARIDAATVRRVSLELALLIGPIAEIVVRRAVPNCASVEDLYLKVAEEIDSPQEREKFLLKHASMPQIPTPGISSPTTAPGKPSRALEPPAPSPANDTASRPPEVPRPTTAAGKPPEALGTSPSPSPSSARSEAISTPPSDTTPATTAASEPSKALESPPSSTQNKATTKAVPAATGTRSSNRPKSLLLASAGGVVLILLLVLGIRFATTRQQGGSRTAPQEAHVAESAPATTAAPTPPTRTQAENDKPIPEPRAASAPSEREFKTPQRVRVSIEVAQSLLLSKVEVVYPPLARQAHIQGAVVLEVNISKEGKVESLTAVSGHPLLIPAAIDAVKQWRYKPFMLNGEPVGVNTRITVDFRLTSG